jgi:hypothetical protein
VFPAVFRKPLLSGVQEQNYQATAVTIGTAGTGYTAGDTVVVDNGFNTIPVELTIGAVDGSGGVTSVAISNAGDYTEIPTNPVTVTGGSGSGATFDMTFVQPYKFWVHEVGTDEIDGLTLNPVQSYFETGDLSLPVTSQVNKALQVLMLEPDFVQSGDMTVSVRGRANARAQEVNGEPMTFPETPQTPQEQVVFFKTQRRELRFRFESNTLGGDYQMGLVLAHLQPGDGTVLG